MIAGGSLLLNQQKTNRKRKRKQWACSRINSRYIKGAYYSMIIDLKLTAKEDFGKYLRMNTKTSVPLVIFI